MRLLAKVSLGCFTLAALALIYSGANVAVAQDKKKKVETKVKVGDPAPAFSSVDETGKVFKSTDVVGKKILVLYFYPADFTGGCTAQACKFRDDFKKLTDQGVEVVGVSGDNVKSHEQFKKHHKLPFTLLADEKGEIASKFGVPFGKGGKVPVKDLNIEVEQGVRIQRVTFVIGKDGKIIYKEKGDTSKDPEHVLKLIEKNK